MKIEKLLECLDESEKDSLYFLLTKRNVEKNKKEAAEIILTQEEKEKINGGGCSLISVIKEIRDRAQCPLVIAKYAAEKYRDSLYL